MTTTTPTTAQPPSSRDIEVISLVGLAHGTSHFFHLLLPPLFPWLMPAFGLNFTQAGFLMTVFFAISTLGQAVAGFVVDRVGPRPVLFSGIGLLAVSGVVLSLSTSYSMLLLTAAFAGMGNSIFHPSDFTLLNRRVSSPRLGIAFTVHSLTGNLGWAAAPILLATVAGVADWHWAGLAASAVAVMVLLVLVTRRHVLTAVSEAVVVHPVGDPAPVAHPLSFLRSLAVWMCFAFFFLSTMAFGILQNFSPTVLKEVYGIGVGLATSSLTAYLIGGAAGIIAGGFLTTRYPDNDRMIAFALTGAAVMSIALATGALPGWMVPVLMAIMGWGVGIAGPNRDLLVRKAATAQFGKAAYGRVYGFVYSGLDLGLATAPLIFGRVMDAGHFHWVLASVAVLQVLAIFTALRVGQGLR